MPHLQLLMLPMYEVPLIRGSPKLLPLERVEALAFRKGKNMKALRLVISAALVAATCMLATASGTLAQGTTLDVKPLEQLREAAEKGQLPGGQVHAG